MREFMQTQLAADRGAIRETARTEFPEAEAEREHEVYSDLRERTWREYIRDRRENRRYYQVIDSFREDVLAGDIEGCVDTLRRPLGRYLQQGGRMNRRELREHLATPVGYALVEALARCHWHHNRDFEAAVYLHLLQDERREVTFGERVYFNQVEELREDAQKAERMPHLVGEELLEMEPRDLDTPSLLVLEEAERRWQRAASRLGRSLDFHEDTVQRARGGERGALFQFPARQVQVPIRECEETDRIDRIRRDGSVVYQIECETIGYRDTTKQTPDLQADRNHGVGRGDWIKFAYNTADHDEQKLFIAAESDDERARVKQVFGFDVP